VSVHCLVSERKVPSANRHVSEMDKSAKEVATNTGRRTFSPWALKTGKNNGQISTFHSTDGALSFIVPFIFVNIVHIYTVSIRVRVRIRVRVSVRLKVSIT